MCKQGCKCVPVEPTQEMCKSQGICFTYDARDVYLAMLAAAPSCECRAEPYPDFRPQLARLRSAAHALIETGEGEEEYREAETEAFTALAFDAHNAAVRYNKQILAAPARPQEHQSPSVSYSASEASSADTCEGCGGTGEVGGFVNAENGYQTDPCPFCSASDGVTADAIEQAAHEWFDTGDCPGREVSRKKTAVLSFKAGAEFMLLRSAPPADVQKDAEDARLYRRLRNELLTNRADTIAMWESMTGDELDDALRAAIAAEEAKGK